MERLKKFNQFLLALLLGASLLFILGIMALIAKEAFFPPWSQNTPQVVVGGEAENAEGVERSVIPCLPQSEPTTGTMFIGLAVVHDPGPQRDGFLNATISKGSKSFSPDCTIGERWGTAASIQNVVVVPKNGEAQRLLFETPVRVEKLIFPTDEDVPPNPERLSDQSLAPPNKLYWELRTTDTDGNGLIDHKDALGAYLSELDGTGLRRITPEDTHLSSARRHPDSQTLLFQVQVDTNGDRAFGTGDEVRLLAMTADRDPAPRQVLAPEIVDRYRRLLGASP